LIELEGLHFLTDPLLTSRVSHLSRTSAKPVPLQHIDAVLLSHLHSDHVHLPSLRRLGKHHLYIAPHGAAPFLARHGFHQVIEMKAGERVSIRGVDIEATHTHHPGRRVPWRPITDCLGYILYGKQNVYFAGDTDLFDGMVDISQRVDVALLPVWGWGPTLGVGHMDPYRAARAVQLLQPSLVIPIHWGTYFPSGLRPIMPQFIAQPPYDFARYANQITPEVPVCVLDPGDALDLTGFFNQMGTR
jgi:L-ascorbate metabolism protein UlaG (beta-lactamase superfamily)